MVQGIENMLTIYKEQKLNMFCRYQEKGETKIGDEYCKITQGGDSMYLGAMGMDKPVGKYLLLEKKNFQNIQK